MYELKKYHGDRVQSLTYDNDQVAFSVGIISPGEYQFGAMKKEIYTVTSGKIDAWTEESDQWNSFTAGETFTIPYRKNYKLKVTAISSYVCFYE